MKDHITPVERLRAERKVGDRIADELFAPDGKQRGEGQTVLVLWIVVACLFGVDLWVRFS